VGKQVGQGKKLPDAIEGMKMVAEGVSTAEQIPQLQQKTKVYIPLLQGVHDILFKEKKVSEIFAGYQAE
jgi:glycerol-3-phosphate dehydrogenase (NAD(P)+)